MNELRLAKKVYDHYLIDMTVEAFSDIADIVITESDTHFVLNIDNCKYSRERTAREFENYLIDLTNKERKW